MKKLVLILIFAGMLSILTAHPASKVEVKFDIKTKMLSVEFFHSVKTNSKHFITEVVIELNGKEIITQQLNLQDDNKKGDLSYKIVDAKENDKIKVTTRCNKGGKKGTEIKILVAKL